HADRLVGALEALRDIQQLVPCEARRDRGSCPRTGGRPQHGALVDGNAAVDERSDDAHVEPDPKCPARAETRRDRLMGRSDEPWLSLHQGDGTDHKRPIPPSWGSLLNPVGDRIWARFRYDPGIKEVEDWPSL